jgi:peptidylprolyl isomerase
MNFRINQCALAAILGMGLAFSSVHVARAADAPAAPVTLPDGLKYVDLAVGKGPAPVKGHDVVVTYVGKLTNGQVFDASANHGGSFTFTIGVGQVIKGWDEGVATMHVGGKRRLTIPASLAYGERGAGGVIPPNATLIFDIELLDVK